MMISWTFALAYIKAPPIGANMMPTAKKRGKTVLGVRIGCHAFNRCCRNAVSVPHRQYLYYPRSCNSQTYSPVFCSSAASYLPPHSPSCYFHPSVPSFATSCQRSVLCWGEAQTKGFGSYDTVALTAGLCCIIDLRCFRNAGPKSPQGFGNLQKRS